MDNGHKQCINISSVALYKGDPQLLKKGGLEKQKGVGVAGKGKRGHLK